MQNLSRFSRCGRGALRLTCHVSFSRGRDRSSWSLPIQSLPFELATQATEATQSR
jgi:hypothetical protein